MYPSSLVTCQSRYHTLLTSNYPIPCSNKTLALLLQYSSLCYPSFDSASLLHICTATSRILIQDGIYDEFVAKFKTAAATISKIGDQWDETT